MNDKIKEKVKQYIQDNIICKNDIIINISDDPENIGDNIWNYIVFDGHYTLSLEQLKEIANILKVENIFIEHKYDQDTWIKW